MNLNIFKPIIVNFGNANFLVIISEFGVKIAEIAQIQLQISLKHHRNQYSSNRGKELMCSFALGCPDLESWFAPI